MFRMDGLCQVTPLKDNFPLPEICTLSPAFACERLGRCRSIYALGYRQRCILQRECESDIEQ